MADARACGCPCENHTIGILPVGGVWQDCEDLVGGDELKESGASGGSGRLETSRAARIREQRLPNRGSTTTSVAPFGTAWPVRGMPQPHKRPRCRRAGPPRLLHCCTTTIERLRTRRQISVSPVHERDSRTVSRPAMALRPALVLLTPHSKKRQKSMSLCRKHESCNINRLSIVKFSLQPPFTAGIRCCSRST